MSRFNHDAKTIEDIKSYAKNRALQVLGEGATLESITETYYGALIKWKYKNTDYFSLFITPEHRNKGVYIKEMGLNGYKILTVPDCEIEEFLKTKKIEHVVLNRFLETPEYKAIDSFYKNEKAKRSGVFLMNHIDEGLAILDFLKADETTKKAYCLHPILQEDSSLKTNYKNIDFSNFDPKALILAMEYRSVANEYLSYRKISSVDDIRLSPLKEIQEMLKADKIQNYKDFLLYHQGTHPRTKDLELYFNNWLEKLEIKDLFKEYKNRLVIPEV